MYKKANAFTIVELLIVIVVIAILAAVSIVAYRGIQERARDATIKSELSQIANKVKADYVVNETYPASVGNGGNISYSIISDAANKTFCITGMGEGYGLKSIDQSGQYIDGPCDGLSGGEAYCPNNSYITINGYYCEGTVGAVPQYQASSAGSHIIKFLATDAGVPANAPGYFVGRQTDRDVYSTNVSSASAGDVFCVSGWVSTATSTVNHRIGVRYDRSTGGTLWQGVRATPAEATGVWRKLSGCFTAPTNTINVRLWTQNDAGSGSAPVAVPWYQTAIVFTKQ